MKLILKRSELGRGVHWDKYDNKYCAVGIYLKELGVDTKELGTGETFMRGMKRVAPWLTTHNIYGEHDYSDAWTTITNASDRFDEAAVIREFAKHGVEVEYID